MSFPFSIRGYGNIIFISLILFLKNFDLCKKIHSFLVFIKKNFNFNLYKFFGSSFLPVNFFSFLKYKLTGIKKIES